MCVKQSENWELKKLREFFFCYFLSINYHEFFKAVQEAKRKKTRRLEMLRISMTEEKKKILELRENVENLFKTLQKFQHIFSLSERENSGKFSLSTQTDKLVKIHTNFINTSSSFAPTFFISSFSADEISKSFHDFCVSYSNILNWTFSQVFIFWFVYEHSCCQFLMRQTCNFVLSASRMIDSFSTTKRLNLIKFYLGCFHHISIPFFVAE